MLTRAARPSVALHSTSQVALTAAVRNFIFIGSFTISTNVGTMSGSASGSEYFPCASHFCLSAQLILSVESGTGSFVGTTGNLQFETLLIYPFTGSFSGAVSVPAPATAVLLPSNGTTVSGSTILDASATNATSVEFRLFGGIYGYSAPVLCTATLTQYGWLCSWNSATVPNGSYVLLAEASNSASTAFSPNVNITVKNPPGQHRKTTA